MHLRRTLLAIVAVAAMASGCVSTSSPAVVEPERESTAVAERELDRSAPVDYAPSIADELLPLIVDSGVELDDQQCTRLVSALRVLPFESTPQELRAIADDVEAVADVAAGLRSPALVYAAGLDLAAESGADRVAIMGMFTTRPTERASEALAAAANRCEGGRLVEIDQSPGERMLALAEHDHPDLFANHDVRGYGYTRLLGDVSWTFYYRGRDPVAACNRLSATLASVGFDGVELTIEHDNVERAAGSVGGSCAAG